MNWTLEQINTLAPDTKSAQEAQKLASGKSIFGLATDGNYIWAECQGSGKDAYLLSAELATGTTKCNCMAYKRGKIPCKHGLGLLFIYVNHAASFTNTPPPPWVETWIQVRKKNAERKEKIETKSPEDSAKDALKKEKTTLKNWEELQKGIQDAILWTEDLVRTGISQQQQAGNFGDSQKSWMSNAKAEGLRAYVDEMNHLLSNTQNASWAQDFLNKAGEFYLLLKTLTKYNQHSEELQTELRQMVGFSYKKEEIYQTQPTVQDHWRVVSIVKEEIEDRHNVTARRIWLYGVQTQAWALCLDFGFGGNFNENYGAVGTVFKGEIVYYPGINNPRCLIKSFQSVENHFDFPKSFSISENLERYAIQSRRFFWMRQFPFSLQNVRWVKVQQEWKLCDEESSLLGFRMSKQKCLHLLAITGNQPFQLFGEWHEAKFTPLTIWTNNQFFSIAEKQ